jgi:hypothetical protein
MYMMSIARNWIWTLVFMVYLLPCWGEPQVFIQKVHEEPKTPNEDPQDYIRISIDGIFYQCAMLDKWQPMPNISGAQFAAIPPSGSGVIGVRVEKRMNAEGKPHTALTQSLIDAELKRLKSDGSRYEGELPPLEESSTTYECQILRIEETHAWKCHYRFSLIGNELWTYICESPPSQLESALTVFGTLTGSFRKIEDGTTTPIARETHEPAPVQTPASNEL